VQGGEQPVGQPVAAVGGVGADQFDLYGRQAHLAEAPLLAERDEARDRAAGGAVLGHQEVLRGDRGVLVEQVQGPVGDARMGLATGLRLKVDGGVDRGQVVGVSGLPGPDDVTGSIGRHRLHM
jgi:hypothetical protein